MNVVLQYVLTRYCILLALAAFVFDTTLTDVNPY